MRNGQFTETNMEAYKWRAALILAIAAELWVCFAADARADVMKWTIDGVQREALVLAPSKPESGGKVPVIFAFHGHGGTMLEAASAGFQTLWPEALVVCMQGLPTKIYVDPEGTEAGWQQEPGQYNDRDLKFFDAVLATLRAKFRVDDRRIYSAGFSNGAIFTYLLWATRANTFAAFASVAGDIFPDVHLTAAKPLLQVAGESDDVVPFAKQTRAIEIARALNGGTGKGRSCGQNCTIYESSGGTPVKTYIHPGGHEWPAEAAPLIVDFFKSNVRR